jgi:hypothetical protein
MPYCFREAKPLEMCGCSLPLFGVPSFPFPVNILYSKWETGNGKRVYDQSGSELPHSEGALRAQIGETPAFPGGKNLATCMERGERL